MSNAEFLRQVVGQGEPDEAPRDYLTEALGIIAGRSMYLPQREHLLALWLEMSDETMERLEQKENANGA
jgi:hypothetical protein